MATERHFQQLQRHAVHGDGVEHIAQCAGQYADSGSGAAGGEDSRRDGTGQSYFDPLAFRSITDVRYGNSGLNTCEDRGS